MSGDFDHRRNARNLLLTGALFATIALSQWCLASGTLAAGNEPGAILLAQNPPCGKDPQHPCPKGPQAQPQPKQQPQQQPQPQQQQRPVQNPPVQQQQRPVQNPPPVQQQQRPVQNPPVQQQQRPVQNPPVQQQQRPVQNPPVQQQQQPVQNPPVQQQQRPVQNPPVQQQQQPVQNPPVQQQQRPVQNPPVQQQQQPVQNPPVQQQQQPVQNPPLQQQQRPVQNPPVQQQQQQPVQNQPPRQQQQQPIQNQPPQGQPVQNQPRLPQQGQPPRFGNIQQMQQGRQQHVDPAGRTIIEEPDRRQIVREVGRPVFIRHDENERFLRFGQGHVERRGNEVFNIVVEPNGYQLITVTDPEGRLIRRFRRGLDGREIVLINNALPLGGAVYLNLPEPVIGIPQDQYIVDTGVATEPLIYAALEAPPLVPIERAYSLDEILNNAALRDRMRRIDVDTITFDTGSWEVTPDQVGRLDLIAQAMQRILGRNPNEVFLVEGHTDAVGNDVDNLSLSDRRAETVADILSSTYQIPPENLTTQGYGAQFLKIPTPEANRQNRRVTIRRITPLLVGRNG